jgi:uncharacterized RDD family membrane protein YckC
MKVLHSRVALTCALLLALAGTSSAQVRRAQNAPQPPVEVERDTRTAQPPAERPYAINHRTAGRVFQDYYLGPSDAVPGVWTVLGDATIEGRVEGDVVVVLGTARLTPTGSITGSLVVVGGGATVEGNATVGRDLVIVGGVLSAPPMFSPGGEHVVVGTPVFGDAIRGVLPWFQRGLLFGRMIVPGLGWVWMIVAIFFFIYLVLNTAFDHPVAVTADAITERPVGAFFSGLLVMVLAVPVIAILAATVVGILVIPFLVCGLVGGALVGKAAVARAIGRGVIRPERPEGRLPGFAAFVIGFVILTLAYMIPILGFMSWALASVLALGGAMIALRTYLRRERAAAARVPPPVAAPANSGLVAPALASGHEPSAAGSAPAPADGDAGAVPSPIPPASYAPPAAPPIPPRFIHGLAQYPRATFLDRLAAFALDCILVAIANGLLGFDRHSDDGMFFFLLLVYHMAFWAWKGTTLGGIICNLRVTRTDGTDLRPVDAVVRGLSGIFSIAALGIGCLWMLQDSERQMWHDKIAGTLVVKVPREVVLA